MLTVDLHLLLQKFNKYTFVEDTHTYYCNGYPVSISVTTFIQRYFPKFDFDNISIRYANKHNLRYNSKCKYFVKFALFRQK